MTTHKAAIIGSTFIGALLLVGALFGHGLSLNQLHMGVDRTLRDVSIALWIFLLPSWFTFEENFAPEDPDALVLFRKRQQTARGAWTIASGAIFIVVLGKPEL